MAVAFDAFTAGGASFTHTPVGTPRGVLVLIAIAAQNTDTVTAVTYGGTAMTEVALSPLIYDGTKDYVLYGYFLGASVPTGAQTVATTASAGVVRANCITLTAAADTEVVDTTTLTNASLANPSGTLSLASRTSFCAEVWGSGIGNPLNVTPLTNWTSRSETDEGNNTNGCYTYDTIGSTDVTFGYTATAEEVALLAVAVSEVSGGAFTLDADAGSYAITGTAAALEFDRQIVPDSGTYAINGSDATLQFGNTLAADAGSYAISGTVAALEFNRVIDAGVATYTINGSDAGLDYVQISTAVAALTYGAAPHTLAKRREYEAKVRAFWERQEELERERKAKEERLRELQKQQTQLDERKKLESRKSAVAKRRAKLAREIEEIEREQEDIDEQIADIKEQIQRIQTMLLDRRRRMVLLLAAVA